MPKVIQVIESEELRGKGIAPDVMRMVTQYHTLEGVLLAEYDPHIPAVKSERPPQKNPTLCELINDFVINMEIKGCTSPSEMTFTKEGLYRIADELDLLLTKTDLRDKTGAPMKQIVFNTPVGPVMLKTDGK